MVDGEATRAEPAIAQRFRDVAAVTLAVTSGATDAVAFLKLGGAFTSVMTGNLVLLGISLGHADGSLAGQIGFAVVGYIGGCAVGIRVVGRHGRGDPVWPPGVTRGLAVETVFFVAYAAGWWAVGGHPAWPTTAGLLAIAAFALGVQSAAVNRFGVSGLSTTYLTGTLTTLVTRLAGWGRFLDVTRHLALLVALVAGAAMAALLLKLHAVGFIPLLQLVPLAAAMTMARLAGTRGA